MPRFKVLLIPTMLLVVASCSSGTPVDPPARTLEVQPGDIGPFDADVVQPLLTEFGVPGVSIAVVRDFDIAWVAAYGLADTEAAQPVTTETLFQAGSIGKPVAAMASLRAVQEGYFGLDQEINTILTSWTLPYGEFDGHAVTPRALMSHTSGTGDGFGFPGYPPDAPLPTVVEILDGLPPANMRSVRLERPPSTAFEYSGGGVVMQRLAMTDAVGLPFERVTEDWIFGPLEMGNSTFRQPLPADREDQAAKANGGRGSDPWRVYPELGLWTTPTDLARFVIEVQKSLRGESNRVLTRAMTQEMVTPVGVGPYAVGFAVRNAGEGWYFEHGGDNDGFRSTLIAHRSKGYGLVIMANTNRAGELIDILAETIQRAHGWDMFDDPVQRGYGPSSLGETAGWLLRSRELLPLWLERFRS